MKILVIEDSVRLADTIAEALQNENYAVDIANDGQIGYEHASTGIYDMIILDLMLPKMNGYEVLSALRRDGDNVPVLILSAKTELDDKPTSKFLRIFLIATIKAEIKISIPSIDLEATRLLEPEKTNEIIISEKLDISLKDINIEIVNVVEQPKMIEAEKEKPQPDNGGESLTISCLKCNFINIIKQDTQVFICQKCGTDLFS